MQMLLQINSARSSSADIDQSKGMKKAMANSQDYNKTLNLPQTDFDMRAGLPKKEPTFIKHWNAEDLYENMVNRNMSSMTALPMQTEIFTWVPRSIRCSRI